MQILKYRWFFRVLPFLLLLLIAGFVLWCVSPAVNPISGRDSGVFQYIGWKILDGDVPYLNAWDHKPPAVFLLIELGLLIGNGSGWGVWLIEWISFFNAALFGYFLIEHFFGSVISGVVTSLGLFTITMWISESSFTTEYGLSIQFIIILLIFQFASRSTPNRVSFFIFGILAGYLFLLKRTLFGVWISIWFAIIVDRIKSKYYQPSYTIQKYYQSVDLNR